MKKLMLFLAFLFLTSPVFADKAIEGNLTVTGNVGIGTSNPVGILDVEGTLTNAIFNLKYPIIVGSDTGATGLGSIDVINNNGYQGLYAYTHTAAIASPTNNEMSTAGIYSIAENDYTGGLNIAAYGAYIEGRAGNSLFTAGTEIDIQNTSSADARITTPYSQFGGGSGPVSSALWINTSGTKGGNPAGSIYDNSMAIGINAATNGSNYSKFKNGIVFNQNSITGVTGALGTGMGNAISMANGHQIAWYGPSGNIIGKIGSQVNSTANSGYISFNDSGITLGDGVGTNPTVFIPPVTNSVNYIVLYGRATGQAPTIVAGGFDTNVTLNLQGQGTGGVLIGTGNGFKVGNASAHAGQATCWTTNGAIGYCTTVVGSGGGCTCTGL